MFGLGLGHSSGGERGSAVRCERSKAAATPRWRANKQVKLSESHRNSDAASRYDGDR